MKRQALHSLAHLQQQYARPVSRAVLFAGIIGLGCGIGLRKMARISGTIKEDALEHGANWHFSRENLVSANDRIVAFIDGLELPETYRRKPDQSHTASDGQKFEVTVDSRTPTTPINTLAKAKASAPTPTSVTR